LIGSKHSILDIRLLGSTLRECMLRQNKDIKGYGIMKVMIWQLYILHCSIIHPDIFGELLQNISSTWMSNLYKATLYCLDSEVEIEDLSMFSKITDTELYFIFYIYIKIMRKF
jgi:hypothetical protein